METYCNPIKKQGDFADPFVLRYNGTYYLYCTNPDVRCWSSQDLVHWSPEGSTVPEDEFPGLVPFAPEVVYWNGAFYMYTSPHGFGHYVLKSDSPAGPFRKITGNVGHAIDFSVFIDDDGQWYAYWADDRGILGCKMASPTEFGEPTYIGADLHGWTEGPFVVKQEGKYHLTYTGNHFLSRGYRIHAAVADSPLGPYRDDPWNPVIVQTEGEVVGLGHSSTVPGPDLRTHYIVYHNLNPDKTRDLNIDPILFTPEKAYVLGPTTTERPAPALPSWCCHRGVPQKITVEDCELPMEGEAEFHLTATGSRPYGMTLGNGLKLAFRPGSPTVTLTCGNIQLATGTLPRGYDHQTLHCLRITWDMTPELTVSVDGHLLFTATVSPGSKAGYFGDPLVGTATVTRRHPYPSCPVPCVLPGKERFSLDIREEGLHQILTTGTRHPERGLLLGAETLLPVYTNGETGVAIYRCHLTPGQISIRAEAGTVSVEPYHGCGTPEQGVMNFGPTDKCCNRQMLSDVELDAALCVAPEKADWQAGILLRATQLADGGEGNDKVLGTNFFIGYRVCLCHGKLQLWKHRYDATLLAETPFNAGAEKVNLRIWAKFDRITVTAPGCRGIDYRDPQPITRGYCGFHTVNAKILMGSMTKIDEIL